MIKAALKSVLSTNLMVPALHLRYRATRPFGLLDRRIRGHYLAQSPEPKLHIGCGYHTLSGWLNTDYLPGLRRRDVMHLDATRPYPFDVGTFDYVYSEHMIEHIGYPEGVKMLTECHRVLKPSGKICISTPNLAFLLDLVRPDKSEVQRAYIKFSSELINGAADDNPVFVINSFMRDWGHMFIYDETTLRDALSRAGFTAVAKHSLHESDAIALRNLENEGRMPPDFLHLETLTLEGSKK